MRRVLLALMLCSCGKGGDSAEPAPPACPPDSAVSWESFAGGFMDTWCVGCHSASLSGDDRHGAPAFLDFDSYQSTVPHLERIRFMATGEDRYAMPPVGETTAADRARLLEWIECGGPGDATLATGCEAPLERAGEVVLTGQYDADALCAGGPTTLTGDLVVEGAAAVPCLCAVQGSIEVKKPFSASALTTAGSLSVRAGGSVVMVELDEVAGVLDLEGSAVQRLQLPRLRAAGELRLVENPQLTGLDLPRLAAVGGDLTLQGNPVLVDLDQTLALEHVGGVVSIRDNDALLALEGLRFVGAAGSVEIVGNDALSALGGFELLAAVQSIAVHDNPALERLDAFDSLHQLGGSLSIRGNAALGGIDGFGNLTAVGGDLELIDNPSLGSAAAQAFADGLAVTGTVNLSNNGP